MIIISEKLNSSIPSSLKIMENGTDEEIKQFIMSQVAAGASYIDLNAALCKDEAATAKRIADIIIDNTDAGIAVDSPSATAMEEIVSHIGSRRKIIINSITVNERHENISLAKKYSAGIIAVLTSEKGVPETAEERKENAEKTIKILRDNGISDDNIYIDIVAKSAAVSDTAASSALKAITLIKESFPDVHITCGLSNISFGLPQRKVLNSAFFSVAAYLGMDAPICDATAVSIRSAAAASGILSGTDEYCMEYIEEMRGMS